MVLGVFCNIFLLVFYIHFSLFYASSSLPPPVAGALPFRGVEVGFEEPHLRLML